MSENNEQKLQKRDPVVAVMGHVDHGKSSLLDYIRKSNITAGEAGGITQHISAYEVPVEYNNKLESITFLDTPGHAAFSKMRHDGAAIADIAILIVSATEGVKPQTREAIDVIRKHKIPFVVAINKIDLPGADIDRTKSSLLEHGIYVEGYGGDISAVAISAKTGQGVDELLQIILLHAEIEDFAGNPELSASGFVLESHSDPRRGVSATLVIKDGCLRVGNYVLAGTALAPVRTIQNFLGKGIKSACFSAPVVISGFDSIPMSGIPFQSFNNKKTAEGYAADIAQTSSHMDMTISDDEERPIIPIILKTDVVGVLDAARGEIEQLTDEHIIFKIVRAEAGNINEADIRLALGDKNTIILGFNTTVDAHAKVVPGFADVRIQTFDIIYKLSEWLDAEKQNLRSFTEREIIQGEAKILKVFSSKKDESLIGAKIEGGSLAVGEKIRFVNFDGEDIGGGEIVSMKIGPSEMPTISGAKTEFGALIRTKTSLSPGVKMRMIVTRLE